MLRAPTASRLALRDQATLAILGLNMSSSFGAEFGDDYGDDAAMGAEFGDDYGAEFGDDMGAVARRPPATQAVAAWKAQQMARAKAARRASILEPNKGSAIKVERYAFSISQAITMGTAVGLAITGNPDTTIRPQRVTMNAPAPMFAFVNEIKVANVSVTVGAGAEDAFNYSSVGVGQSLDMPTLSPANRASVLGTYSGFTPPGYLIGFVTQFTVTFKGPASVIA